MKTLLLILCCSISIAQVGINTTVPSDATALDIAAEMPSGNFGGLSIDIVTLAQRDLINVGAASEGTLIFTDKGSNRRCLQIYDALQNLWQDMYCINTFDQIFISEYIEADGNNKFIELYNPTSSSIDLSAYKLIIFRNGGDFPIDGTDREVILSGTIPAFSTFVIAHSNQTLFAGTIDQLESGSNFDFGGDDPIVLVDISNTILDAVGIPGTDPGTGYSVDGATTENVTLRRNISINVPNATWTPSEWQAFPNNDVTGLGSR